MATFDLGRVTPLYKGDYSATASYELNDVVLYNGNLYWHIQATATVGILPTDTTVWKLAFADEGIRTEIRGYADNAQASANSALASKSAAAQSASQASASASQAALSAQTAQTAETGATASAQTASTKASEASVSAQSAASSAQTATDKATLASQKAAAASEFASLATAKAQAAATSETNAAASATTATTKASEAAASATSAQEYDESAQQSAVNAQASATNAAASEAAAKSYAEDSAAYFGAYPTDTAEGEIASFSDGADDVPMKSLVIGIEPVQRGEGDPSPENIRPISGWTGAKVSKSGVNLWDEEWVVGTVSSSGVPYALAGKIRSKNYIPVKQGTTLYFKGPSELRVAQYDASKTFISYTTVTNGTLTMTNNTCFVMFAMDKADETYDGDISINYPATDTAYHPYAGESIDISFPTEAGTIYGGKLDVLSGKLTVEMAVIDLGTLTYVFNNHAALGQYFSAAITALGVKYGGAFLSIVYNALCSAYKVVPRSPTYLVNGTCCFDGNQASQLVTQIQIKNTAYTDATAFKTAMSGVQLVYELATPITYQLTPHEVSSLLGQNNIWADTGDTTVEYRANTSAYVAKKIAEAISALS